MAATVERPLLMSGDAWNPAVAMSASASTGRVKKVSWAPDAHLVQVRLFAASDVPHASSEQRRSDQLAIQVAAAKHTEAAMPKRQHSGRPGRASRQAIEAMRPAVAWRSAPRMTLNPEWHVPAGDESTERAVQDSRIRGTLEAIYLHGSAIPNSPAEPEGSATPALDDAAIPLIPLMPVDDEAVLEEEHIPQAHSGVQAPPPPPSTSQPPASHQRSHHFNAPPSSLPPPPPFPPPQSAASGPQHPPLPSTSATSNEPTPKPLPALDNRALLDLLTNPALLQLVGKNQGPTPNQALEQLAGILGGLGQGLRPPLNGAPPSQPQIAPPPPRGLPPHQGPAQQSPIPPPRPPPGPAPLPPGRPPLLSSAPPPPTGPRPLFSRHPSPRPPPGGPPGWPPQERPRFEHPRPPLMPGFTRELYPAPQRPLQPRGEWRPPTGGPRGPPPQFNHVSPPTNGAAWDGRGQKGGGRGPTPPGRPENMRDKKLCLYFNTPQGCHKGENCTFFHARQAGFVENLANASSGQPPAKRTKLDGNANHRTQS